jgi:hypothetical protein
MVITNIDANFARIGLQPDTPTTPDGFVLPLRRRER